MRILLVEDDELLGEGINTGLQQFGYTVDWVKDGISAQTAILTQSESFDAIILDLGLPRKSGMDVLKTIRKNSIKTPVLILTARDELEIRIEGLDSGANDFIIKPFKLEELCARIRAQIRGSLSRAEPKITVGTVVLDPAAHKVFILDEEVNLSRREFALLQKLMEQSGKVLTRDSLTQTLYGWGEDVDSNTIEVYIHNLRKKFHDALHIRTIRGVGYIIELPKSD